jgi:hypothetical protein
MIFPNVHGPVATPGSRSVYSAVISIFYWNTSSRNESNLISPSWAIDFIARIQCDSVCSTAATFYGKISSTDGPLRPFACSQPPLRMCCKPPPSSHRSPHPPPSHPEKTRQYGFLPKETLLVINGFRGQPATRLPPFRERQGLYWCLKSFALTIHSGYV